MISLFTHELPRMTSDLKEHNMKVSLLHKNIYQVGDVQFFFKETSASFEMEYLSLKIAEETIVLGLSKAILDMLFRSYGVATSELSRDALNLLLKAELSARLPSAVILDGITSERPSERLKLELIDYASNEALGLGVSVLAEKEFSLSRLIALLNPILLGYRPHPFDALPIPLPLVAVAFEVPAGDLATLAVGDVLLTGETCS